MTLKKQRTNSRGVIRHKIQCIFRHFIVYCSFKGYRYDGECIRLTEVRRIINSVSSWSQVDDINAAIVDLKAKNIRTLSAEPRIGAHGKPVMFLHPKDCDGVLVELEQA